MYSVKRTDIVYYAKMDSPIPNSSLGQTQTTTPIFSNSPDAAVLPILQGREKELKSQIPATLQLKVPSPSKDLKDYATTGDPIFKAKAKSSYQSLQSFVDNVPKYVDLFGGGKVEAAAKPDVPTYWIRNNGISHNDLEEAKAVLFGEISNRDPMKQQLEAQTILNTAFNRMDEYNQKKFRGKDNWTLTDVLQEPNQYQAYRGNQYNKYKSGNIETLDRPKLKAIDGVLSQIKNGKFQDNIGDSTRYSHRSDGRIIATDEPLFK